MTDLRRRWIQPLDDNAVLAALDDAGRELMGEICQDEPEDCTCRDNQMTPLETIDWIRREVLRHRRGDDEESAPRLEPAGRPGRLVRGELRMAAAS